MTFERGEPTYIRLPDEADAERVGFLFDVLADYVQLDIITELLESPRTQKELTQQLGTNSSTISRKMSILEEAGLVIRERSHSPYHLAYPATTLQLLRAAAQLSIATAEHELEVLKTRQERLERLKGLRDDT